jgi:hypothetical protein
VEFAAELEASLKEFSASGLVELRENGGRAAPLEGLSWEVRGHGEKPLLHIWSECFNLTRRVLAITDHSEQRLALAVERFGRLKPDRLEFIRTDFQRHARDISRQEFCENLKTILAQQFPDEILESLVISEDLEHSLPGTCARGVLRRGSAHTAVMAVSENESPDTIGKILTFGLLWLDRLRSASRIRGSIGGLRLILPAASVRAVAHSCDALASNQNIQLFAWDTRTDVLEEINIAQAGNIDSWLVPHREFQELLDHANNALAPIVALAPRAITLHPSQARTVVLRFRGLQFAYWDNGQLFLTTNDARHSTGRLIHGDPRSVFAPKLQELEIHRHPLASDTRHALYRAQPERWLETLVREDVTRIDACLDTKFVYAQVFANSGGAHGILDILCATRSGRLAILELKASEHIHLPLQAAEYWLRIQRHLQQGDFQRYGYFPGVELQKAPPLVYLVAPALRFHPTTDVLLRYLARDMEVLRIGLAESWRRGLRVVQRH